MNLPAPGLHRFALWAVIPVLLSCAVKEPQEVAPPASDEIVLTGRFVGGTETKTVLDDDYTKVLWMPHETISVFGGGEMAKFISDNTEKAAVVNFTGKLKDGGGTTLFGLYPYDQDATIKSGVITTNLPDTQEAKAGSFADHLFIAIAKTDNRDLGFNNVCSGFRFMLDRSDIQTVTLLSNGGEPLAGKFSVGIDKDGKPTVKSVAEGVSEITLSAPGGKTFASGVWYYIVTLPTNLAKGYTVLFEGDDVQGCVRSSEAIALNRNKFRSAKLGSDRVDYKTESDYDIENAGVRAYLENVD